MRPQEALAVLVYTFLAALIIHEVLPIVKLYVKSALLVLIGYTFDIRLVIRQVGLNHYAQVVLSKEAKGLRGWLQLQAVKVVYKLLEGGAV